jgi:uncharacterized protein (UPF0332 family)
VKADAEAYLTKAGESLAAAEADLSAGRYNASTARAYYAAFQASIAILIENEIRPRGNEWQHRFVISEFSGKLVRRRKVLSARFSGKLDLLLKARLVADYRPASVSRGDAREAVSEARDLAQEIARDLGR